MSLGCARCGDCCERIYLNGDVARALRSSEELPLGESDNGRANAEFMRAHWTEMIPERDAPIAEEMSLSVRFTCDQFDAEHRLCMAHDGRPPVCRDFPWYGRKPGELNGGTISKRCSYWLDAPPAERPADARPLIPITALRS